MKNYITLNIKHLCSVNNLTQNDFGGLFDLKRSVVGMYVSGKANPKVGTIQKICVHFKISIDDFINCDLSNKSYNKSDLVNESNLVNESQENYGIDALKRELDDKIKIIELLERENNFLRNKNNKRKIV